MSSTRFRIFLTLAAIAALAMWPTRDWAQAVPQADTTHWRTWASLSFGPGNSNGVGRIGGMIALWGTHGTLALSLRNADASRVFDPGDTGDISLLAGLHFLRERHADGVIVAGIGESYGHGTGGEDLESEPVIAASAQLNLNFEFVGVGLDAFAGVGSSHRYGGVGLALAVGWFR